jgi:type II secretory pathway component PulK
MDDLPIDAEQLGAGMYWLVIPDYDNPGLYTVGISDEAAKLNLNTATLDMLMALPNMTQDIAEAIIDWRDPDSDVTGIGGAEDDYYLSLPEPYYCKNGPFESVEELLLVKGITPDLLYGTGPASSSDVFGANGRGWIDYLTAYSAEPATGTDGQPLVDVNAANTGALSDLLNATLSGDRAEQVLQAVTTARPFSNIFDFYYRTGLNVDEFSLLAEQITARPQSGGGGSGQTATLQQGRIDLLTAPRDVLACLPGLDDNDIEAIIADRQASFGQTQPTIAWVVQALSQQKVMGIADLITARSYQPSCEILATDGHGRAFCRVRVVFDCRTTPARIIYRKDVTQRGWPLDPQLLQELRNGQTPQPTASTSSGVFY